MKFSGLYFLFIFSCIAATALAQEKLVITPSFPERGQQVVIRYFPEAPGALIPPESGSVDIMFTYSNFYELPWKLKMHKKDRYWEVSFPVPRYAVYATFYIQSGEIKDQPSPQKHYELAVFSQGRRVKSGFLYESYSLQAQMGKQPDLEQKKAALLEKELQHFPDNYEAKLRLLNYKILVAPEGEKMKFREQAREIIAAKFMENPGNTGLMNSTTMGYLIIGENSRLDSIRAVVREKYPETESGYSLRIAEMKRDPDTSRIVKQLESLLKNESPQNKSYLTEAHDFLFEYYAAKKQKAKALYHLSKLDRNFNPYLPVRMKEQAEVLLKGGIALDTALALAKRSLAFADTFPVGIIRYFPETAYIPSYVDREARKVSTQKAKGNVLSLMAMIRFRQGFKDEAKQLMKDARSHSSDAETLANAGDFYQSVGMPEEAFQSYKLILISVPEDTLTLKKMKASYTSWKKGMQGWDAQLSELQAHWKKEMREKLNREIVKLKAPDFLASLVDLEGKPVSYEMTRNKVLVLDFWATWCVPCMKEMPYVQNAYEKFRNRDDVLFMVINSGSNNTLQDAKGWKGNKTYSFPVFYNTDRSIGEKFGFNVIPATYIIDKTGQIRFKTIGFEGPVIQRKIESAVEMLLE
jgi:thiol-disulfide isomerase/thioredoxin